jgi:hypothetical protein
MKKKILKTSSSQTPLPRRAAAAAFILSSGFLIIGFLLLNSDSSFVRILSYVLLVWGFSGIVYGLIELYKHGNHR